jgi:hypothetical protein
MADKRSSTPARFDRLKARKGPLLSLTSANFPIQLCLSYSITIAGNKISNNQTNIK